VAATIWGVVKNGCIAPRLPLPEGARVEIRLGDTPLDVPAELRDELEAWQRAGAEALGLVERPFVQVFQLTMDNPEDQDELNRRFRKPGEPAQGAAGMNGRTVRGDSITEAEATQPEDASHARNR
jgi:hypothetical protein